MAPRRQRDGILLQVELEPSLARESLALLSLGPSLSQVMSSAVTVTLPLAVPLSPVDRDDIRVPVRVAGPGPAVQ